MLKQIILPFLLVGAFVIGVGLFVKNSKNIKLPGIPTPASTTSSPRTIMVNSTEIKIETANTQSLRTKGLSGRLSLEENGGMLFVFETQNASPVFWMKDMFIPIDIIWINDGKIVKIDVNIQPPKEGTPDKDLSTYTPGQPIDYVLEVNAGFSDKNGIKVSDEVQFGL